MEIKLHEVYESVTGGSLAFITNIGLTPSGVKTVRFNRRYKSGHIEDGQYWSQDLFRSCFKPLPTYKKSPLYKTLNGS